MPSPRRKPVQILELDDIIATRTRREASNVGARLGLTQHSLAVDSIEPNPDQPRKEKSDEALEELIASIRQHGILQPIRVRQVGPERYQVVAGERRWRAAKVLGLADVPAVVAEVDDDQAFLQALVENVVREDLSAVDRARALQRLRQVLRLSSWEEVGERVGIGRVHVHRLLNVTKLPEVIREDARVVNLLEPHARALAMLRSHPAQQRQLWERIHREELSGRAAMAMAATLRSGTAASRRGAVQVPPPIDVCAVADGLCRLLDQAVALVEQATPAELQAAHGAAESRLNRLRELLTGE